MMRAITLATAAVCAACEAGGRPHVATDSAPAATHAAVADSASDTLTMRLRAGAGDSAGGDTSLPSLRLRDSAGTADSGTIRLYPAALRCGGVIVAVVAAAGDGAPSCSWQSVALPCSRSGSTIRAIVPLPADEPAGQFVLSVRAPGVSARRTVVVADRDFGRQIVLLDSAHYALVRRSADIARDARALRQVLEGESDASRWSGRWLNPGGKAKAEGYGVERLYFPASDSSRVMSLGATSRTTGSFGSDTTLLKTGDTPSWRHAGLDIALARGSAVRAAAAGIVVDAGEYVLTGRTVILDHGRGIHTAYFHLDTITVHRGDAIRRGDRLGRVGSTGLATGPHLHYGVYIHGKDVDPAAWHDLPAAALSDSPGPSTSAAAR